MQSASHVVDVDVFNIHICIPIVTHTAKDESSLSIDINSIQALGFNAGKNSEYQVLLGWIFYENVIFFLHTKNLFFLSKILFFFKGTSINSG